MKQKMVIGVQMKDEKKRSRAMKIAAGFSGVSAAAVEGADRDRIVVVGDGVDAIALTTLLRKRMGFAQLVSVAAVEDKKEEKNPAESTPAAAAAAVWPPHTTPYTIQYSYEPRDHYRDPCCIM